MRSTTYSFALAAASIASAQDTSSVASMASSMASSATGTATSSGSASSTLPTVRPSDMSMCNYYADAVFNTTDANSTLQYTLLTALVNTAVIGNYSSNPGSLNAVTGILNNGTYQGRDVSLGQYFNGMLASTNRGGDSGVAVNFLDGGAAEPLMNNTAANDTSSNQYFLLTHLYQYFGKLLNCSGYDTEDFPSYGGDGSQYEVHKFMDLSEDEINYFIQEVGLAATSFGVSADDAMAVGMQLTQVFNNRCGPELTVIPEQGPALQSICLAEGCPEAANASCSLYQASTEPSAANDTNTDNSRPTETSSGGSGSATPSGESGDSEGAATAHGVGAVVMAVAGLFALAAGL